MIKKTALSAILWRKVRGIGVTIGQCYRTFPHFRRNSLMPMLDGCSLRYFFSVLGSSTTLW